MQTYNLQHEFDKCLYTDQTGRFPYTSFKGNQYVMVAYNMHWSNAVLVEPMRNQTTGEMLKDCETMIQKLPEGEARPTVHILDNECSRDFKQTILDNQMTYHLVPPHDHRRNAQRKQFIFLRITSIPVLFGTDETFSMRLWCALLPRAVVQLNMMRASATNP